MAHYVDASTRHPQPFLFKKLDKRLWPECELFCHTLFCLHTPHFEDDFSISEALNVLTDVIDCDLTIDVAFVKLICIYEFIINNDEKEVFLRLLLTFILSVIICDEEKNKNKKKSIEFITSHLTTDNDFIIEYMLMEWIPNLHYRRSTKYKYYNVNNCEFESILSFYLNDLRELALLIIEYTQFEWTSFIEMVQGFFIEMLTIDLQTKRMIRHIMGIRTPDILLIPYFITLNYSTENQCIAFEMDKITMRSMKKQAGDDTDAYIERVKGFMMHNMTRLYPGNPKYFMDLIGSITNENELSTKYLLEEIFIADKGKCMPCFPRWDKLKCDDILFIIDNVIIKYLFDDISFIIHDCFLFVPWLIKRESYPLFHVLENHFLRNKVVFDFIAQNYRQLFGKDFTVKYLSQRPQSKVQNELKKYLNETSKQNTCVTLIQYISILALSGYIVFVLLPLRFL